MVDLVLHPIKGDSQLSLRAEVVRVDPAKDEVALRFLDLQPSDIQWLDNFMLAGMSSRNAD